MMLGLGEDEDPPGEIECRADNGTAVREPLLQQAAGVDGDDLYRAVGHAEQSSLGDGEAERVCVSGDALSPTDNERGLVGERVGQLGN